MNAKRVNNHFPYVVTFVAVWLVLGCFSMEPAASEPDTPPSHCLWDQWNRENGFPYNQIRAIAQTPDGFLWIAGNSQLLRFDGVTFVNISAETGLELINHKLFDLRVDKNGGLLIGGIWGLTAYEPKTGRLKEIPLFGQGNTPIPVTLILEDKTGSLWIGTRFNYLYRISRGENVLYDAVKGLPCRAVSALCETGTGGIRVGTSCGLFTLQNDSFHEVSVEIWEDEAGDGLPVTAVSEDGGGILWIGSNNGLLRVGENNGPTDLYTTAEGLSDNRVTKILETGNGTLWVGTADGLNRIKKGTEGTVTIEKCLEGSYITSLYEDGEGGLWIGTNGSGMKRLRDALSLTGSKGDGISPLFPAVIEKIVIIQDDGQRNAHAVTAADRAPVYKDIDEFSIYFTVPAFIGRENIRFRYRLDGYDDEWREHDTESERRVAYTSLRPGKYTFMLTAGTVSTPANKETAFTFHIEEAFYKNTVFRTIILSLLLGAFTAGILLLKERFLKLTEKYKGSTLNAQQTEKILKRLNHLLEIKKVYRDEEITPESLSEKLSIPPTHLSRIIDEILNKNFIGLINGFRIEESKKRLLEEESKTLLEISSGVGFKSKAAFYRAFKKHTGTSPSEFRKNSLRR